jgi:hypothetical protein
MAGFGRFWPLRREFQRPAVLVLTDSDTNGRRGWGPGGGPGGGPEGVSGIRYSALARKPGGVSWLATSCLVALMTEITPKRGAGGVVLLLAAGCRSWLQVAGCRLQVASCGRRGSPHGNVSGGGFVRNAAAPVRESGVDGIDRVCARSPPPGRQRPGRPAGKPGKPGWVNEARPLTRLFFNRHEPTGCTCEVHLRGLDAQGGRRPTERGVRAHGPESRRCSN